MAASRVPGPGSWRPRRGSRTMPALGTAGVLPQGAVGPDRAGSSPSCRAQLAEGGVLLALPLEITDDSGLVLGESPHSGLPPSPIAGVSLTKCEFCSRPRGAFRARSAPTWRSQNRGKSSWSRPCRGPRRSPPHKSNGHKGNSASPPTPLSCITIFSTPTRPESYSTLCPARSSSRRLSKVSETSKLYIAVAETWPCQPPF